MKPSLYCQACKIKFSTKAGFELHKDNCFDDNYCLVEEKTLNVIYDAMQVRTEGDSREQFIEKMKRELWVLNESSTI